MWRSSRLDLGSSPLTRGGLLAHQPLFAVGGLIPAYAGRTFQVVELVDGQGAHPRLRGADLPRPRGRRHQPGSSPLTRGGRRLCSRVPQESGLIPAYAGRTTPNDQSEAHHRAHPRLRGADYWFSGSRMSGRGSSPLTRGGHPGWHYPLGDRRLIPAYAGRTRQRSTPYGYHRAHPRLRGADAT